MRHPYSQPAECSCTSPTLSPGSSPPSCPAPRAPLLPAYTPPTTRPLSHLLYELMMLLASPFCTSVRFHWPMQGPHALASTVPPTCACACVCACVCGGGGEGKGGGAECEWVSNIVTLLRCCSCTDTHKHTAATTAPAVGGAEPTPAVP